MIKIFNLSSLSCTCSPFFTRICEHILLQVTLSELIYLHSGKKNTHLLASLFFLIYFCEHNHISLKT